jgi:hypothetical protein
MKSAITLPEKVLADLSPLSMLQLNRLHETAFEGGFPSSLLAAFHRLRDISIVAGAYQRSVILRELTMDEPTLKKHLLWRSCQQVV